MAYYMVTGAAGFIGSRVSEMLLNSGNTIVGIDDMNDAYDVRLKHYRLKKLQEQSKFRFYQVNIANLEALEQVSSEAQSLIGSPCDAIINLAARAGVRQSVENPWIYLDTNITGTLNLLELCRRYGIPKFVLASTSSVYGANAPLPTPETCSSDYPLQPYAASKKAAETLCYSYHFLYGLDITVFRYFTVYGPAGRPDMSMLRFTHWINQGKPVKINGDGQQSRGFTYIDDIAEGTILGLRPLGYEIINLGGHEMIKIIDLIHLLEGLIRRNAELTYLPAHPADMLANWADISKAQRLLAWEPRVSLVEGTAKLAAWYDWEQSWISQIDLG
jgi:UDP-glucuronate 4-epimerase